MQVIRVVILSQRKKIVAQVRLRPLEDRLHSNVVVILKVGNTKADGRHELGCAMPETPR